MTPRPGVSLRLFGDKDLAQGYIGDAFNLLAKAMQVRGAGDTPVQLARTLPDGTVLNVKLLGGQTIVSVTSPTPAELEKARVPIFEEKVSSKEEFTATMLSGVTRKGFIETVDGVQRLDGFRPTYNCAAAYGMAVMYAPSTRLAVPSYFSVDATISQYRNVKPSMYSGAMKRVVQAVNGLGIITDTSPLYLTGEKPEKAKRAIQNKYDWRWQKTHGVVKTGTKNHWLVEISNTNGVVAMPLPLFKNTTTAGFRSRMQRIGDYDTINVLDEFGGLPNGEVFPATAAEVNALIASGKAIRLLAASDLDAFYKADPPGTGALIAYGYTGWAFADDGNEARNICVHAPNFAFDATAKGYDVTALYQLKIRLSPHVSGQPLPAGSAELSMLYDGYINNGTFVGNGTIQTNMGIGGPAIMKDLELEGGLYEAEAFRFQYYGPAGNVYPPDTAERPVNLAPGHVFFDGNEGRLLHRSGYCWAFRELNDARTPTYPLPILPAYCREALFFQYGSAGIQQIGFVPQNGYISGVGALQFSPLQTGVTVPGAIYLGVFNWYENAPYNDTFYAQAVVNAGPTKAYIVTNGVAFREGATIALTDYGQYQGSDIQEYFAQRTGPEFLDYGPGLDLSGYPPRDYCFIGSV